AGPPAPWSAARAAPDSPDACPTPGARACSGTSRPAPRDPRGSSRAPAAAPAAGARPAAAPPSAPPGVVTHGLFADSARSFAHPATDRVHWIHGRQDEPTAGT